MEDAGVQIGKKNEKNSPNVLRRPSGSPSVPSPPDSILAQEILPGVARDTSMNTSHPPPEDFGDAHSNPIVQALISVSIRQRVY